MFTYLANALSVNVPANTQAISSSGATTTAVDVSGAEGPITITIIVPAGGTNTMAIQPVHSITNGSGYTNVPADALLAQDTGLASTFASVSTAASVQTLVVNRELVRRYLALTLSGSSLTQTITVVITFLKKYVG